MCSNSSDILKLIISNLSLKLIYSYSLLFYKNYIWYHHPYSSFLTHSRSAKESCLLMQCGFLKTISYFEIRGCLDPKFQRYTIHPHHAVICIYDWCCGWSPYKMVMRLRPSKSYISNLIIKTCYPYIFLTLSIVILFLQVCDIHLNRHKHISATNIMTACFPSCPTFCLI